MRHAGPVRRELGVRTVFNLLGPLTNPGGANTQLLGVADPRGARPSPAPWRRWAPAMRWWSTATAAWTRSPERPDPLL